MHHIEITKENNKFFSSGLYGTNPENYFVVLVCKHVGRKLIGSFTNEPDAELFAKAKSNELRIEYVRPTKD